MRATSAGSPTRSTWWRRWLSRRRRSAASSRSDRHSPCSARRLCHEAAGRVRSCGVHRKELSRMTTLTRPNGLVKFPAGAALLGEIITWSCSRVAVRHLDLVDALTATGLDAGVARELAPRHAF